jgi:hypothetical protein
MTAIEVVAALLPKTAPVDEAQAVTLVLQFLQVILIGDGADVGGYGGSLDWDGLKGKLESHSLFKELRNMEFSGCKRSVDVVKLFEILDADQCPDQLGLTDDTVSLLMKAPLFQGKTARNPVSVSKVLSHLSWPSLFAVIAGLNDDTFGLNGFSPHRSRRDATRLAAQYLLSRRPDIQVRLVAVRACLCRQSRGAPVDAACCLALVFDRSVVCGLQNFLDHGFVAPHSDVVDAVGSDHDDGDTDLIDDSALSVVGRSSGSEQVVTFRPAMGRIAVRL